MSVDSAFNTAVSFVTNTNWQDYTPEQTAGYLTQMLGLTVQNFLSAATGIVVVVALVRGLRRVARKTTDQSEHHDDARRSRQEVLYRQAEHLRQIASGLLRGVILPVGVGNEADGR